MNSVFLNDGLAACFVSTVTQPHVPRGGEDEERLVADIIKLARQYGRYGYLRIAALLLDAGWQINDKCVERLWRHDGQKVPSK